MSASPVAWLGGAVALLVERTGDRTLTGLAGLLTLRRRC